MATGTSTFASIDADALATLQSGFGGQVLSPGSVDYDAARTVWNGMIDAHPAVTVRPSGVADVVRSISFAREQGLEISVKGGGHNVAGYAVTDGGLMIDLENLRQVHVDPDRRTALAGGGARWADFDRETAVFGLAATGGVISTTGVAGLTLGGGVGWLVGLHGLASDNLLSATLVTADGQVITASDTSHPDLFWALRGGGGNFGVVTSMEFRLHPLEMVLAGMIAYPIHASRDVLEVYRELTATGPDELGVYCAVMTDPESGQRVIALPFCWAGDIEQGRKVIQPLLEAGHPVVTIVAPMPYAAWSGANDALYPFGRRQYWKGALVRGLPDGLLDTLLEYTSEPFLPGLDIVIEWYSGAINRVDADDTAFPHRDARYQVVVSGTWDDPADDDRARDWTRGLYAALEPFAKQGSYLNFVATDESDRTRRIREGYGDHWDRLVGIKRRYDPQNVFHRNNTITP